MGDAGRHGTTQCCMTRPWHHMTGHTYTHTEHIHNMHTHQRDLGGFFFFLFVFILVCPIHITKGPGPVALIEELTNITKILQSCKESFNPQFL